MIPDQTVAWLRGAASVFTTTLTGLAFETIPFLLMGTLLSAVIRNFVPDRVLQRFFPRNRFLSILVALGVGVFVPICECGTVPLARRLRQKGLPLSTAAAFLLAAPLVNPMTIISTWIAFRGSAFPVFAMRLGFGLGSALLIAVIVELATRKRPSIDIRDRPTQFAPLGTGRLPAPPRLASRDAAAKTTFLRRAAATLEHASYDFLDTGRYLVLGITLAAAARAVIPSSAIQGAMWNPPEAVGTGLFSAYVLSLCSSADAFVARSIFGPVSYSASLAFLALGPMIDLKNTVLLSRFLRPRHLAAFVGIVFLVVGCLVLAGTPIWEII